MQVHAGTCRYHLQPQLPLQQPPRRYQLPERTSLETVDRHPPHNVLNSAGTFRPTLPSPARSASLLPLGLSRLQLILSIFRLKLAAADEWKTLFHEMAYPTQEAVPSQPKRVAIYGGAFDPPTNSHLTCAAEIVHSHSADEVWLVPCGPRPDKPKLKTPAVDRYCMCQIAVNTVFSPDFPVKVSDIDMGKKQAAFTYDLLVELKEQNPNTNFAFVIGSDWLQPGTNIAEWTSLNKAWKEGMPEAEKEIVTGDKLLQEFEFLVVPRPGYDVPKTEADPTGLKAFGPRLRWMQMPEHFHFIEGNLSSTEIRKRSQYSWRVQEAAKGGKLRTIEGLVPPGVLSYIRRGRFYEE